MGEKADKTAYQTWFLLPLEQRQQEVDKRKNNPEELLQLAREIGINTGTTSFFGRGFELLEEAKPFILNAAQEDRIEVLDVGAGLALPGIVEVCRHYKLPVDDLRVNRPYTYEPFELLAFLRRIGLSRSHVHVLEIDPLVSALLRIQNEMVIEQFSPKAVRYYNDFRQQVDPEASPVLTQQIPLVNARIADTEEHYYQAHLVTIPRSIRDAITVEQGDIEAIDLFHRDVDIVYYFAVSIYLRDKRMGLENAVRSLRKGGLLFTTVVDMPQQLGLQEMVRVKWRTDYVCYRRE